MLDPAEATPLPSWLQPVVSITTQVGVPTVFAAVLLWFVLTRIGSTLDVIKDEEEARTRIVAAMQDTVIAAFDRQTDHFEKAIELNIRSNRELAERYHHEGRGRPEEP